MERFWRASGIQLGKYWWAVLGAMLAITALLGLGLPKLEFATGQDSYLNDDSQIAIDNVRYQENFGGETAILLFQAQEGHDITELFQGENLEEMRRLEAELREIPEVYAVLAPLTAVQYSEAIVTEGVGTNALLSAAERDPDPEAQEIRQADISTTLARLTAVDTQEMPDPDWVNFLLFDNTGFEAGDDGVVPPADGDRSVRGSLRSTFPNLQTAVGGVVIEGNADLDTLSSVTEQTLDIVSDAEFEGFDVITTGSPVFLKDINDYLQGGMLKLGAAALAIMAVILLLMFRVRWRLLPLLSVLVGVVWAFSILGLINVDLSLVTISGLPILIGLGIDFAIQIQNRVEEEVVLAKTDHPMSQSVANLAPALIVATIAGVLAFLALLISQVPMIRDFGVMLAIGVVALVTVGIVLPTSVLGIREWKRPTKERATSIPERIVVWLGGLPAASAVPLLLASVVLFVAGVAFEGSIRIESDPVRWIDQSSQTVKDVDTLGEATGFSSNLGVLVSSNNVLSQPVTDVVFEFSEDAESTDDVVASSSVQNTIAKIINIPGATPLAPTSDDLVAAAEVMPPDIEALLLSGDRTATQVNLRLAPASLEERAVLVEHLEDDLNERIEALGLPEDSILLTGLQDDEPPIRAIPSGLAVVGVGLLENLSANRAILTYLGLALVAMWLLVRHRSPARALLTMIPIGLAVGTSTAIVGAVGLTLSPLTTVSGPLVIATCTEFSVLIMARFLEERQRGLQPAEASDQAARRTGRAFFISALTTIGGFAVLISSPLPLLRDFGIIVTLNVAIALLAALVAMPPILQWADAKGFLDTGENAPERAVVLASKPTGARLGVWIGSVVVVGATVVGLFLAADSTSGDTTQISFEAQELPTTTTAAEGEGEPAGDVDTDPANYGTERPTDLVGGTLFDALTAQDAAPNAAVCTGEVLLSRVTQEELISLGIAEFTDEALEPVIQAAQDCGIDQETIDATVAAGLPG
ncbi:MAG: MMPL family transporter [Microthrixaceae bacterium]